MGWIRYSRVGRLGLRVARTWIGDDPDDPRSTTGRLQVNYEYDFLDNPVTTFSSYDGPVEFAPTTTPIWLR